MERTGANPVCLALIAALVVSSVHGAAHAQFDETAALDRQVVEFFRACKPAEAIPLAKQSLELREKALAAGDPAIIVNLQALALLYVAQGLVAEAEPLLKRVDAHEKKLPAGSPTIAKGLDNLATLCLAQWRLGETEALLKRALDLSERSLPVGHHDLAPRLATLGGLYATQGRFAEAEPLLKRALEIIEKTTPIGNPEVAPILQFLAVLYVAQGRFAEAEPLAKRSIEIFERALPAGHPNIATALGSLALLYQRQWRLTEAEALFKRALEMRENAQPPDPLSTATSLSGLAGLYQVARRAAEAEPLLKRALEIEEKMLPEGHPRLAINLGDLATAYRTQGKLAVAEPLAKRALASFEKSLPVGHFRIAWTLNELAALSYAKGAWVDATNYSRRASTIIIERSKRASQSAEGGATDTARSELSQNTGAFEWLMLSARSLAEQRPDQRDALSEEAFTTAQWAGQTSAGAALAQMAVRFARGEGELSRLVRTQQNLSGQWRQLDKQIVAARSVPPEQRNAALEATLAARLADTDRQLVTINARLAREFPGYAALAAPEPLSIKSTQEQLRSDEALIQFAFAWNQGFAWLVTSSSARWVRLGGSMADIRASVQMLRCGLDYDGEWLWSPDKQRSFARKSACAQLRPDGLAANEPPPFNLTIAHELYEALFGPIKDSIVGKHLFIVPAGALTSLPFHVLVTDKPALPVPSDPAVYAGAAWVARSHAITVLPSVASLKSLRTAAGKSPATKPYIAFGNPLLTGPNGTDRRAWAKQTCNKNIVQRLASSFGLQGTLGSFFRGGLSNVEQLRRQPPLPETADELCAVARDLKALESEVYLGARATEHSIKNLSRVGKLKSHRIVHFATHGLLARETESLAQSLAEPALLLTPPDKASEEDDGLLTASEVTQLELNADWVILSACNTAGAGDTLGAEALSGLARAFFYAGARALLVSHWYVDSDGAVKLTTRAVSELRRDPRIGRAEALRRAMLALMTESNRPAGWIPGAHPAVWAPFVVVGEGRQ
jgi:CHAT domain-containing protein/tetratricopeptide (TPR) repeat protein